LGGTKETSEFINLTAHVGDALEISGGVRHIEYSSHGALIVAGAAVPDAAEDSSWTTNIYNGSVKYNFTEDFMTYATVGTSWRPGISAVGDFSLGRSALENSFLVEEPEKSTTYEIGFKASALDKRLRTNMSFYHQKYTNYPYRSTGGVWYIESFFNRALPTPAVDLRASIFNFVAAVPVEVNGVEAQVDFSATPNWDIGAVAAYSKGEIKGGFIPCTDLNRDGVPDAPGVTPTLLQLQNAVGGVGTVVTQPGIGTISGCTVTQSSSSAPRWSAVLQSEYRLPINAELNSFLRGQATFYDSSENDPLNPVDGVSSYALLNVFVGLRDASGAWEVSLYAKNLTNTEERLTRSGSVYTTPLNSGRQSTNFLGGDQTQGLILTAPREFGLNLRYAFGSH
jgi:iron complex outermembrane receptor protein